MGIWATIKAAFGTSTPPDARRLSAVNELALSASIRALVVGERGWITLSEARALFGDMDQVGKASLAAFAAEREHRSAPEFMPAEGRVYFTRKAAGLRVALKIVRMHGAKDEVIARVENLLICKAATSPLCNRPSSSSSLISKPQKRLASTYLRCCSPAPTR
jgi:hypothetical protein